MDLSVKQTEALTELLNLAWKEFPKRKIDITYDFYLFQRVFYELFPQTRIVLGDSPGDCGTVVVLRPRKRVDLPL